MHIRLTVLVTGSHIPCLISLFTVTGGKVQHIGVGILHRSHHIIGNGSTGIARIDKILHLGGVHIATVAACLCHLVPGEQHGCLLVCGFDILHVVGNIVAEIDLHFLTPKTNAVGIIWNSLISIVARLVNIIVGIVERCARSHILEHIDEVAFTEELYLGEVGGERVAINRSSGSLDHDVCHHGTLCARSHSQFRSDRSRWFWSKVNGYLVYPQLIHVGV